MKISIITSCYNREATIRDAIKSVLTQDYPDIEYIIVDGGSTDGSIAAIREAIIGHEEQVKFISEPDHGMYEAINKGIRMATGDIIGLVHSDDYLYEASTISKIVAEFQKSEAELVYGNGLFVDYEQTEKIVRNWISGSYSQKKVRRGWLPLHPTVYIRKECIEKWGLYDESYKIAADSDFLVRYLYEADLKVAYLNEYVIRMRMGGLSTDSSKMKQKWAEDIRMYRSHGFNPYWALSLKIASKVPQFIQAKFMNGNKG
ncbi:MAG: glycosyltransferase [Bacteroides sp.]|nr:glycosyltransferase [Bacteroides sp.]